MSEAILEKPIQLTLTVEHSHLQDSTIPLEPLEVKQKLALELAYKLFEEDLISIYKEPNSYFTTYIAQLAFVPLVCKNFLTTNDKIKIESNGQYFTKKEVDDAIAHKYVRRFL